MSEQNNDDDLTTDAIPIPPGDETIENNETIKDNGSENINIEGKSRSKTKFFKKGKKSNTTAFASVINISNAQGIHIGSNYNVYLNNTTGNSSKKKYVVSDCIKTLFKSNEPVERKHLLFITPHVNEDWRTTARLLDFSEGQISQFYEDYIRSGIKEVIYQLLLDWIQNEADTATIGRLAKVLWESNQQDAVQRWSEHLKN